MLTTTYASSRLKMTACPKGMSVLYFNEPPGKDSSRLAGSANNELSLQALKAAIEKEPEQPLFWYAIGVLYFNARLFADAVTAFEQAGSKGYKPDADYYLNLGTACLQVKQTTKGIRYLHRCLDMRPKDTAALQAMAHASYQHKEYQQAINYWSKLLQVQPQNSFVLFMLGKSYIGQGEKKKGEQLCDQATAGL